MKNVTIVSLIGMSALLSTPIISPIFVRLVNDSPDPETVKVTAGCLSRIITIEPGVEIRIETPTQDLLIQGKNQFIEEYFSTAHLGRRRENPEAVYVKFIEESLPYRSLGSKKQIIHKENGGANTAVVITEGWNVFTALFGSGTVFTTRATAVEQAIRDTEIELREVEQRLRSTQNEFNRAQQSLVRATTAATVAESNLALLIAKSAQAKEQQMIAKSGTLSKAQIATSTAKRTLTKATMVTEDAQRQLTVQQALLVNAQQKVALARRNR